MAELPLTPLILVVNSDPVVNITVTQNGAPFDLTGATLDLIVKDSPSTADAAARFTLKSYGPAPAILITNPATTGQATADFTGLLNGLVSGLWYRLQVTKGGRRLPAAYGPLEIMSA